MTLTIDLTPELEASLHQAAAQSGLAAKDYVVRILQERLQPTEAAEPPHLNVTEAHLLQQINLGLPQETWQQYYDLIAKRQAETLTSEEQIVLIAISDRIEELNVRRIENLVELAQLRQLPLPVLMQQLAIKVPSYD